MRRVCQSAWGMSRGGRAQGTAAWSAGSGAKDACQLGLCTGIQSAATVAALVQQGGMMSTSGGLMAGGGQESLPACHGKGWSWMGVVEGRAVKGAGKART